ncbi:HAMP domain-containing histidine kinase [Clostridium frigoris]|uniref:histidine kinase n=1 Tax=Clostridium frigoris TaxID=205327 RepID=A0ABS6BN49_9CLOT|nr:ATP-binding protein [Clostridium frigoris]MBU3158357.1 HAMP domain-containing histidine kinase [Clostridium frigoris]
MYSIRKKLSIILVASSIIAILLTSLFVNLSINNTFNKYLADNQTKRDIRIVEYFQEVYKRDGKWSKNSGSEMMHEAYMSNYCLTLLDNSKKQVWGMNPNDINEKAHLTKLNSENSGVYSSKYHEIKSGKNIVGYVVIGQYSSVLLSNDDINFKTSVNESIAISVIVTLLITILISLYISKQFSIPIKAVSDMSVDLSKGNFNSRSNSTSNITEIESLLTSINTLGEKLEQQDVIRKRLVSDISHEIRTPLNILQNNLEAMIDGLFPITIERLISLNDEVIRFGKLLNNLNTLKKFESEQIPLICEYIDVKEVIYSVCEDFSSLLKGKNIMLNYSVNNKVNYIILGDKDKLKQVFINLISNAVKFNRNDGYIDVTISKSNSKIMVNIKENGIGIKKEDLPFIFERLYRGDKSRHEIEGNGIGLTVVKNILLIHSASIEVKSEIGEGSEFIVKFKNVENT